MFRRLLVANRGEIAVRILRTCRRLGIETVAVFSEADRDALHVELADVAEPIGPARAAESYLSTPKLLAAARRSGADALHPGYGFLSENADFAASVEAAGIAFVGPHSEAIRRMGSKTEARRLARELGIPVLPGYDGDEQDDEALLEAAQKLGCPLLVKASAGGGGRGIRIVRSARGLDEVLGAARLEAEAAFGDGRLVLERYVAEPRHIEVQVAADRHGGAIHLFERDCSIQRRHQKVVEEAPASGLDPALRSALFAHALELTRAIAYDSVGTVEFLLDPEAGEIFFLEMNTRLQVEHPTTERVTDIDLVELQLRAAAGEPLGRSQADVHCQGWAIEVRVNAEDPARGHRPSTGPVEYVAWPEDEHLRVDTGVRSGSVVTPHYDSLLAKLIASGPDRSQAAARLVRALDATVCFGPATNLELLRQVVAHPAFRAGELSTGFLERHFPEGPAAEPADAALPDVALAALAASGDPARASNPWQALGAWRLLAPAGRPATTHVFLDDGEARVGVRIRGTSLDWGAGARSFSLHRCDEGGIEVELGGRAWRARLQRWGDRLELVREGRRARFRIASREEAWRSAAGGAETPAQTLTSPFPAQVAEVRRGVGERVVAGDVVVVIEAMKMLHELVAGGTGVIAEVCCEVGASVEAGEVLLRFETAGAGEP